MSLYEFFLEEENEAYYPPEPNEDEIDPLERFDWNSHPSLTAEERGGCIDYGRQDSFVNSVDRYH